ncbi:hypothetical protein LTR56_023499 [Elasticomyces elasticus]|nr:hypothetical protein LTR56_023499 [Elasticomyces elasticus]KAK3662821.1 hypothetical protein LTR22_006439 [Elasticomyces elasticus]KAK4911881.1 hypothetical protein LTR49_019596 [Elasticomyces elasticus]KAK5765658.1 hypothetical protein LTS12_004164 [Elasticomyces elasticus]
MANLDANHDTLHASIQALTAQVQANQASLNAIRKQLLAINHNSIARVENSQLSTRIELLCLLRNISTNQVPASHPNTPADIANLSSAECMTLLEAFGAEVPQGATHRIIALRKAMGLQGEGPF